MDDRYPIDYALLIIMLHLRTAALLMEHSLQRRLLHVFVRLFTGKKMSRSIVIWETHKSRDLNWQKTHLAFILEVFAKHDKHKLATSHF